MGKVVVMSENERKELEVLRMLVDKVLEGKIGTDRAETDYWWKMATKYRKQR